MSSPRQHSLPSEVPKVSAFTSQASCLPTCEKCGKILTTGSAFCCYCSSERLEDAMDEDVSKVDGDEWDWKDAPSTHYLKQEKYTSAFVDAVEGMLDERLQAVQRRENSALSCDARMKEALDDTNARVDRLEEQGNKIFGSLDPAIQEIEKKQQQLLRRVDTFETNQQELTRRVAEFDVAKFESMAGVVDEHGLCMDKLSKDIQKLENGLNEFMNGHYPQRDPKPEVSRPNTLANLFGKMGGKPDRWNDAPQSPRHPKQELYTNALVDVVKEIVDECLDTFAKSLQDLDCRQKSLADGVGTILLVDQRLLALEHRENSTVSCEVFTRLQKALDDTNARFGQHQQHTDNVIGGFLHQALPEIEQKQRELIRRVAIVESTMETRLGKLIDQRLLTLEHRENSVVSHKDFVRKQKVLDDTNARIEQKQKELIRRFDTFESTMDTRLGTLMDQRLLALERGEKSTVSCEVFAHLQKALDDTNARLGQHQQRTDNVIECFLHQALPELKQKQQELFRHVDSCLHIIGVVGEHGVRVDKLFQEVQNLKDTLMPQVLALDAIQAHNIVSQVNSVHAQQAHWRKCSRRICELLQEATNLDGN
eukprot:TRINITY_DN15602_c0_g1_i6.p1 TRINITY_DN15602_c0_g1~~TRINITY_DN15602_c0_g1_i6.p1  ORF type:complete len:594 (-),score=112.47 TRINITY_DN15602_c0_g1_i6:38-1819(-)